MAARRASVGREGVRIGMNRTYYASPTNRPVGGHLDVPELKADTNFWSHAAASVQKVLFFLG